MQFWSSSLNTNARMYLYNTPRDTMAKDPMLNINIEGSRDYAQHIQLSFHVFHIFSLNTKVSTHVFQSFLLNTNHQSLKCFQSSSLNTNARMYLYDTPRDIMAKDPMPQSLWSTSTWKAPRLMPNTSNLSFHLFQICMLNTKIILMFSRGSRSTQY